MLDFLPTNNKREVNKEYMYRVAVFLLIFILIGIFLLIIFFIPSAVYSKYKNKTVTSQLEQMKITGSQGDTNIVNLVKKINGIADILENDNTKLSNSGLMDKIILLKTQNISLSSILFSESDNGAENIVVKGVSKTRDDLTLFNKTLVGSGIFSKVDLPVSDLIKNNDQDFSITLTYKNI